MTEDDLATSVLIDALLEDDAAGAPSLDQDEGHAGGFRTREQLERFRAATAGDTATLQHERKVERKAARRSYVHRLGTANAARELGSIPAAGTTVHLVMAGNFNAWDFVPAILELAKPVTIRRLDVATLAYNHEAAEDLARLMRRGSIEELHFLTSVYFVRMKDGKRIHDRLLAELEGLNARVAAARNHAKVTGIELSDGRAVVIESSANLRSCQNIEQVTITADVELLAFHRGWMDELHALAGQRGHR